MRGIEQNPVTLFQFHKIVKQAVRGGGIDLEHRGLFQIEIGGQFMDSSSRQLTTLGPVMIAEQNHFIANL